MKSCNHALDAIRGNTQTVQSLSAALDAGSLAHAVLLCAPDGCGRNFAARCLAADWLYPGQDAAAPQKAAVLRGESSEVLTVTGEGKSGQIPVDRVREVRAAVFHTALSAAGRVVHIRDAQRMAAPAANALLKVLEEPPPGVLFILTAPSAALLPATITSRCTRYNLAPLPPADCEALLQEAMGDSATAPAASQPSSTDPPAAAAAQPPLGTLGGPRGASGSGCSPAASQPSSTDPDDKLPALLAALYGGCAGLGLRALADPARLAVARDALRAAQRGAKGDTYGLAALLSGYEGRADGDRERREALLDDWTCALDAALNGGALGGLEIPPAAAARLLPLVADTRAALAGNAAPKLAFTALAVQAGRAVVSG